jgi:VIT family
MLSEKSAPDKKSLPAKQSTAGSSLWQRIGKSFYDAIGDIVFGMEDGTVSIFGLVFGVASSTSSSSVVLLAGATGAIAAAVSMMAGTFLDVRLQPVCGICTCHSIRISPPGDRAPGFAHHHGYTLAAAGCGAGPRGTPQCRAHCPGNTGDRYCCRARGLFNWQARHSLKLRTEIPGRVIERKKQQRLTDQSHQRLHLSK